MSAVPESSARAVARLPGLDLTVEVFEPDGEGHEELRVTLRLPRGAEGFVPVMGIVNPMLTGLVMAQAFWGPWLSLWQTMSSSMLPGAVPPPGKGGGR